MSLAAYIRHPSQAFYGWRMVGLGGLISSLNKTAVNKGFPVFVLPIEEAFGISRANVSLLFSLARAESGVAGPLGWLVDRFGPRTTVFVGALMVSLGFILLAFVPNVWMFALVYMGVITMGSNLGFSYSISTLVNNWFHRQKGMAMSSYQAIDSLLPSLLVPVVARSIERWGWETTSWVIGIALLVLILPLTLGIRNSPESMGLTMDGDPPAPRRTGTPGDGAAAGGHVSHVGGSREEYSVGDAMRTPSYWVLTTATALRLVAKSAVTVHIIPILVSRGMDKQGAAGVFGLLLFISVPLYLAVGWLSDRGPKNRMMALCCASGTASFALLALPIQSVWPVFGFIILFAIADSSAPTNWALLGEYFGTKTFSQLRGYVQMANFPGVLLAPYFVGLWYDNHKSYTLPLWVFTGVFALSVIAFAVTRGPRRRATPVAPAGRETQG
ncbi:MAG: MFS transporter [Dehalococcoidia bacterium]|nr:MFS transporter [Dehalococcoidia bacterium]MSQ16859.1 MFS transporter [Dehalococcoidia bacterium]